MLKQVAHKNVLSHSGDNKTMTLVAMKPLTRIFSAFSAYTHILVIAYFLTLSFRIREAVALSLPGTFTETSSGFLGDILYINLLGILLYFPFRLLWSWRPNFALWAALTPYLLFFILSIPLNSYFLKSGNLIHTDMQSCNLCYLFAASIRMTPWESWLSGITIILVSAFLFRFLISRIPQHNSITTVFFASLLIISLPVVPELKINSDFFDGSNIRKNKAIELANHYISCRQLSKKETPPAYRYYAEKIRPGYTYPLPEEFPLLRNTNNSSCLGNYFHNPDKEKNPPNIMLIVAEGLSAEHLQMADKMPLTPFIQQLSNTGISFQNHVTTSSGSENTLAALLGGLPHPQDGFAALPLIPNHFSLINVLRHNNYRTAYYSGQNTETSNIERLLTNYGIHAITNRMHFPNQDTAIQHSEKDWFYPNSTLYNFYFHRRPAGDPRPFFEIVQTKHFALEGEKISNDHFSEMAQLWINQITDSGKQNSLSLNGHQVAQIMYQDHLLQEFLDALARTPEHNNTVYIITGNSPSGGSIQSNDLKQYHVPFIIYSPLLKDTGAIYSISSHNDLYEMLTGFLKNNYRLNIPDFNTSMGYLPCAEIGESGFVALKNDTTQKISLLFNGLYLDNEDNLFSIQDNLNLYPYAEESKLVLLKNLRKAIQNLNKSLLNHQKLMPDSIYYGYLGRELLFDVEIRDQLFRNNYNTLATELKLKPGFSYFLEANIVNTDIPLEEVSLVYEITDESGNNLVWKNFGIPHTAADFNIREAFDVKEYDITEAYLRVYLWNESLVPYHFENAAVRIYRKSN